MPSPIDFTLGALEIGTLISTLLYGVMNIQAYTYYTADIQGCSRIRAFATIVWILETLHAAISWAYMYSATVTYYGQPAHLTSVPWSLSATVVIGGTVATLVQAFFTYRLWRLSRSLYLAIVGWVLAMIHLGAILAVGILASEIKQLGVFAERYLWVALLAIADSLVLDIFNTVGLCYYLNKQQTMFTRTSSIFDHLIAWTIETSLITSVTCAFMLIFCAAMPHNALWIAVDIFYAKIFSNSMFASLNAGRRLSQLGTLANQPNPYQSNQRNAFRDTIEISNTSAASYSKVSLDSPAPPADSSHAA